MPNNTKCLICRKVGEPVYRARFTHPNDQESRYGLCESCVLEVKAAFNAKKTIGHCFFNINARNPHTNQSQPVFLISSIAPMATFPGICIGCVFEAIRAFRQHRKSGYPTQPNLFKEIYV